MIVVRQAGVLLLAALLTSRGLFAQDSAAVATASPTDQVASPADQVKVLLRPTEIRYVHQESVLLPPTAKIKGLRQRVGVRVAKALAARAPRRRNRDQCLRRR